MASNDQSPEDANEGKSLLEPPDAEDDPVLMTTESQGNDKTAAVTMATSDPLTDDELDRIDDMTRRYRKNGLNDMNLQNCQFPFTISLV